MIEATMTDREEFIRRMENQDIKITNITTDVPRYLHQNPSPDILYAHIQYKNEYPFIIRYEFNNLITSSIYIFTARAGRVGSVYDFSRIADRISEYIDNKKRLKNRKENPDMLEIIRQFLKEHGYKISRARMSHYKGFVEYLTVNPIRFSFFVSVSDGNIVYRFNRHDGWPHTIPTDISDPNCKALDSLLTIIKYISTDFDALEAKLNIITKLNIKKGEQ
jgi:hypothetical protein